MSGIERAMGMAEAVIMFVSAPYFMLYADSYFQNAPVQDYALLSIAATVFALLVIFMGLVVDSR